MSSSALKVENLNKAYQLGNISTGTISRDIERWFAKVRGKEGLLKDDMVKQWVLKSDYLNFKLPSND